MRIWTRTLATLRLISEHTGRPMVIILDRLVSAEYARLVQAGKIPNGHQAPKQADGNGTLRDS